MNRVTLAIIAFFSASLFLYWQVQLKRSAMEQIQVDVIERPAFTADELRSAEFDKQGLLVSKVMARHMEHYESTQVTHFTEPVYLIYPESGKAQWQLQASQGKLNKQTGKMLLENNVIIDAINIEEPVQSISTQSLAFDMNTMIMTSDDMLYVKGKDFIIQGLGLYADLEAEELTLLSQVEGTYEAK
ncbi:LPS export ABC transporter periplasmic protein LptC [Shewanella sp. SR44-3]|uniref:LPS export ABC transporter periplasmic protein LptC n=1 Tax=unclassified Shewanella TaxID=196818 RepID=UPI0015FA0CAC|nr:LPS export ABC transporter periplasmic protein LptC [Shewanella sp. SR44-3]MBB1269965.1 LPS export ABC transporter periplasmic protein LptC [Shewanella sp. SR44-3]